MPLADLRISESALTDLESLGDWYTRQGVPEIGERFVSEILERFELLIEHPEMGRIVPEFNQPAIRELIHPPFRIVYRREKAGVQIVRVWRSERLLRLPSTESRQSL